MKKIIRIDNKDYTMQSSAYTQFAYKDLTGRSFLYDLKDITKITAKGEEAYSVEDLDSVTELILKIAFVMIQEADEKNQPSDYKQFVKEIENLYDDSKWINEVVALACTPISRQLQNI